MQWKMRSHRNRAKGRPREHHHDIAGRDPTAFGDELCLTWVLEADRIKLLLRDRSGDYPRSRARAG